MLEASPSPNVLVAKTNAAEDNVITALASSNNNNHINGSTASSSCEFGLMSDSDEASGMLSDIDEVIRDDNNGPMSNVILLNICGVCQKIFTDVKLFKDHEAAGCIDFEA